MAIEHWIYAGAGAGAGMAARAHKWIDSKTGKFSWKYFFIDSSSAGVMITIAVGIAEVFQLSTGFAAAISGMMVWIGAEVVRTKLEHAIDGVIDAITDRIRGTSNTTTYEEPPTDDIELPK